MTNERRDERKGEIPNAKTIGKLISNEGTQKRMNDATKGIERTNEQRERGIVTTERGEEKPRNETEDGE